MLRKRLLYRLGLCGLALVLGLQAGCLQYFHPIDPLPAEEVRDNFEVPIGCKNGVYIFFLHGVDPLDLANFEGVRDYVQSLGYIKTYYGQPFHAFYYEKEIVAIRKRDPNARFVVMGFSYGAGLVGDLACSLGKQGIDIDLLVYVDGVRLEARPLSRPANVLEVVNILGHDRSDEQEIAGAKNMRYNDVWHFGTVTHPQTLRMLVRELSEVALRVPVITDAPPPVPGVIVPAPEMLPAPKPNAKRGEWDFLKPDGHTVGVPGTKPIVDAIHMEPASIKQK
jgi:hypothetical protein